MKPIILIGGGGHCKSCIDVIESEKKFKIVGVLEKKKKFFLLNYKIFSESYLNKREIRNNYAFVTVGQIKSYKIRVELYNKINKLGFKIPVIVSPLAYVSKHAVIGQGTIIMHGAVVNAGAVIGNNCIINTNSLIEHDVMIGDHTHISTEATINGETEVGNNTFIGSGAIIKNGISIGNNCVIGIGKVIKSSIKDNTFFK